MKCKNCSKSASRLYQSGVWFWRRCEFCGFHTSSYLSPADALSAWNQEEHYISENGNKIIGLNGYECYK